MGKPKDYLRPPSQTRKRNKRSKSLRKYHQRRKMEMLINKSLGDTIPLPTEYKNVQEIPYSINFGEVIIKREEMATFQRVDSKKKNNNDNVLKELRNLFGNVLHIDVIKSVASSYHYDIHRSSNVLLEMTSNVQDKSPKKNYKPKKQPVPNNTPKKIVNRLPSRLQPSASVNAIANKSKKTERIEHAVEDIQRGFKVLVLLRGLPGSGKSYLAKALTEVTLGQGVNDRHVFSTDDYFNQQNSYVFDPNKLPEAHSWNHNRAFMAMSQGLSPVIIDNTNVQMWEMKPYAMMATDYGYIIHILEPDTWWCLNDKELAKRNKHKVPRQKIKDMLDRYEKNVTPQKLLSAYGLIYKFQKPPQFRLVPSLQAPRNFQNGFIPPLFSCENENIVKSRSTSALNQQKPEESVGNFMDFNDDFPQSSSFNHETAKVSSSSNLIDDLMGHESDSSDILQPTPVTEDDDKEWTLLDNAWGVDYKALHSWDLAISVNEEASVVREIPQVSIKSETVDGCSNVEMADFRFLNINSDLPAGFKAVEGHCRDINKGHGWQNPLQVRQKTMVDKSSLTDDVVNLDDRTDDVKLKELKNLFTTIRFADLKEIFEKCHKDFNWTVNVLLDDNKHVDEGNEIKMEETEVETSLSPDLNDIETVTRSRNDGALYMERPGTSRRNGGLSIDPQPSASTVDLYSSDSDIEDDNPKGMVELNLGDAFVAQLETKFGNGDWNLPQGYQPVVQVPVGLARQLYAFYVESIFQQMEAQSHILDSLVTEDEEFARKLQAQEQEKAAPSAASNQTANDVGINFNHKNASEWKNLTADTLAAKLTRQKLFSTFPGVQQETLMQIFLANNNNYNETVSEVFVSLGQNINEVDEAIKQPPLTQSDMEEMKVAENSCQNFQNAEEPEPATFYREQANKHLENREALYQKAQSYYQKGLTEVAMFYSDLAKKETRYYDRANHLAATAFLEEHSQRLQKFDTLDLHYLYVKEALPALDLFIDRSINLLQGSNNISQELFVITGRGKRSEGGMSKIKPAVITRLRKRNIQFVGMNPGLLKIWVSKESRVTSDLS